MNEDVLTYLEAALSWMDTHFREDTHLCTQNKNHFVMVARKAIEEAKLQARTADSIKKIEDKPFASEIK